jgi:arylsulfatase A-like enzyme
MTISEMRNNFFRILTANLLLLVVTTTSLTAKEASDASPNMGGFRKPSIILIVADDLGFGDLGCYGQTQIQTPNIDKLATEGMRFTSFYGGASVGVASRAVLFTGKHVGNEPIRGEGKGTLYSENFTLGRLLKTAGYTNGVLGEWGFGGVGSGALPLQRGFDEWLGYVDDSEAQEHYPRFLNRADFEHDIIRPVYENQGGTNGMYAGDFFMDAAQNFMRIWKPVEYHHYAPFFLYLPLNLPRANKALTLRTGNGMEVPDEQMYASKRWPQPEKNKASMITRLDQYVGSVLERLAKDKNTNNTIIILTSGNGPAKEGGVDPDFLKSAGELRGHKGELYEGGIRVPFIAWWHGRIKAGGVSDMPLTHADVLPTLMELIGGKVETNWGVDGISFARALATGSQTNHHESLYWESHTGGFTQAFRVGDWKLVRHYTDGKPELYDLKKDPIEKNDIASAHTDVVESMVKLMDSDRKEDANWPTEQTPPKTEDADSKPGKVK